MVCGAEVRASLAPSAARHETTPVTCGDVKREGCSPQCGVFSAVGKPAAGRKLDGMLAHSFQQAWPWPVCWRRYLLRDARRQPVPEIQQQPATGMGWKAQYWLHRLATEVRPPGRLALACHPLAPVRVPA